MTFEQGLALCRERVVEPKNLARPWWRAQCHDLLFQRLKPARSPWRGFGQAVIHKLFELHDSLLQIAFDLRALRRGEVFAKHRLRKFFEALGLIQRCSRSGPQIRDKELQVSVGGGAIDAQ